jgi:hypothetical protein
VTKVLQLLMFVEVVLSHCWRHLNGGLGTSKSDVVLFKGVVFVEKDLYFVADMIVLFVNNFGEVCWKHGWWNPESDLGGGGLGKG